MSTKIHTNLLGRDVIVDENQGPYPESSPIGQRIAQVGEIVTVVLDGFQVLKLGVLWPDGQITVWPSSFYRII